MAAKRDNASSDDAGVVNLEIIAVFIRDARIEVSIKESGSGAAWLHIGDPFPDPDAPRGQRRRRWPLLLGPGWFDSVLSFKPRGRNTELGLYLDDRDEHPKPLWTGAHDSDEVTFADAVKVAFLLGEVTHPATRR